MKSHLNPRAFALIAAGKKIIELRLYDEKRQSLAIGDEISFRNRETNDILTCLVEEIFIRDTFSKLLDDIPLSWTGLTSKEEIITLLNKNYPHEEQKLYKACGIKIKAMS